MDARGLPCRRPAGPPAEPAKDPSMRNVDDARPSDDAEPGDGTTGLYVSARSRRGLRRRQALIGAAGVAALLGAGAVAVQQFTDDARDGTPDFGARSAMTTPASSLSAPASKDPSSDASSSTAAHVVPSPSTLSERVAAAKTANERAGTTVRRPLPPHGGVVAVAGAVNVTESGSARTGSTMRVVSARHDLTGQRELAWVAELGEQVGKARCANKIRVSAGAEIREHKTLLLCWRTSATKSVYTVAVKLGGRPSKQASVTEIERVWSRLS